MTIDELFDDPPPLADQFLDMLPVRWLTSDELERLQLRIERESEEEDTT